MLTSISVVGRSVALVLAVLAAALIASCADGDSGDRARCIAGQQVKCACSAGVDGYQTCKNDGSGYGPCNGCGLGGSGGWPGFDGGGQAGIGGGTAGASGGAAGNPPHAESPDSANPTYSWVWIDRGGPAFQSHACSGAAGVVNGLLVDPQAFFSSLIQGKDPNNWVQVLNDIEPQLWVCGLGQQRDSGGNVRGRLFLPNAQCPDASPPTDDPNAIKLGVRQEPDCWAHAVDVVGS